MDRATVGICYAMGASIFVGAMLQRRQPTAPSGLPLATAATTLLVSAGLVLQLWVPTLLPWMERNAEAIGNGQVWRLVTALFFQDAGIPGGLFNLSCLVLMGSVAERLWGGSRWLLIYFGCGVVGEVLALGWQPIGAGNSIATLGLSGSLFWRGLRDDPKLIRLLAAVGAVTGVGLLLLRDIHGTAVLLGIAAGAVLYPWRGSIKR